MSQREITIEAEFITETSKAWYLNCEGDKEWFPKNISRFDHAKKEVTAPEFFMKSKFPDL